MHPEWEKALAREAEYDKKLNTIKFQKGFLVFGPSLIPRQDVLWVEVQDNQDVAKTGLGRWNKRWVYHCYLKSLSKERFTENRISFNSDVFIDLSKAMEK